jgi:hypothetical protein
MLTQLFSFLRPSPPPDTPAKCPSCDCRLPLEQFGPGRFYCAGCAKDFRAVRDAHGGWQVDVRPPRALARGSRPS